VYCANEEHHFAEFSTRQLRASEPEDIKIIRRLIEKALELSIKEGTGHRRMHGVFLLEEPIPLPPPMREGSTISWILYKSKCTG